MLGDESKNNVRHLIAAADRQDSEQASTSLSLDMVVSRMVSRATHLGDFQGVPATGKPIQVSEIWIDRIDHGRIVERCGVVDMLTLMEQLGVITN
jgi:predicted ester cyclase